ncbi:cation transporter [Alistipes sp.]|uniref:cation transporter n=1 Tax=Alistipes sp. TaxID=1872444 RepID=UPI003A8BCF71
MKKLLMLCLALMMGAGLTMAAEKAAPKKIVTTVFTADVDCDHCVQKIMNNVPSLGKGIKDVQVSLEKKEVTVVYDASKNNDENIVKGLASLKVKAEVKKSGNTAETSKK